MSFPDLIWDAHWLYDKEEVPTHVATATAHNAVWIWEWERNVKQLVAQCEEPCILYLYYVLVFCGNGNCRRFAAGMWCLLISLINL